MHPTPACIEPDATLIMETERHYADLNISQAAVLIPVDRELELVKYAELDVKLLQPRSSTESGNAVYHGNMSCRQPFLQSHGQAFFCTAECFQYPLPKPGLS